MPKEILLSDILSTSVYFHNINAQRDLHLQLVHSQVTKVPTYVVSTSSRQHLRLSAVTSANQLIVGERSN